MNKSNSIYLFFTIALFCLFFLPSLGQEGMFLDGTLYGSLARNLAIGKGSFWSPYYTETILKSFNGHSPLMFGLESLLFRLFGNAFWIERLFSLILAVFLLLGMRLTWQNALPDFKEKYWIPILFILLIPVVSWCFKSNMIENIVAIGAIFSVFFTQKALEKPKVSFGYLFLAVIFLLVSFLSKGLITLFPLGAVGFYALSHRNFSKRIIYSQLVFIAFFGGLILLLFALSPAAQENILGSASAHLQVSKQSNTKNSWLILERLILEILPILGLTLLFLIIGSQKKKKQPELNFKHSNNIQKGWFWIMIGLSGSLPILLSSKQSGYYIAPALSFFALGLAAFGVPVFSFFIKKINEKRLVQKGIKWVSIAVFILSIGLTIQNWNTYNRDEAMIEDVKLIGKNIDGKEISVQSDNSSNWALIAYFQRYERISIYRDESKKWLLLNKNTPIPDGYEVVDLELKKFKLCKQVD
jgi:hypothetical protein